MKNQVISALLCACLLCVCAVSGQSRNTTNGYYEVLVYHYTSNEQSNVLDDYLKDAYLPALHRQGIRNVGVFAPIANDTSSAKLLFVVIPLTAIGDIVKMDERMQRDEQYMGAAKEYLNSKHANLPYVRKEVMLLEKFPGAPFIGIPRLTGRKTNRVYELRSYESATERLLANKIDMFNAGGEMKLFEQLNFNAVFYGRVLAGSHMPNLMYMTCFNNMQDRDEHWKTFGSSPAWKQLSSAPRYQNNMDHADIYLMQAKDYSDY